MDDRMRLQRSGLSGIRHDSRRSAVGGRTGRSHDANSDRLGSGDTVATLHPDSTGRYEVSDLPAGIYAMIAERYGYIPLSDVGVEVRGETIHPFDILLKKAEPAFRMDNW